MRLCVGLGALGFDWMWWFVLGGVGLSRLWIFVLVTDWCWFDLVAAGSGFRFLVLWARGCAWLVGGAGLIWIRF